MRFAICLLLLLPIHLYAGFEQNPMGARPAAMGGAYAASGEDAWLVFYNPAGLAYNASFNASVFSSPAPYGISELSTSGLAVAIQPGFGSLGAGVRRYGFSLYRELSCCLSYARSTEALAFGFTFNYQSVSIADYGSAAALGFDVGILVSLLDHFRWGMAILNVNAPTLGSSGEPLPRRFSTGLSYQPGNRCAFFCDINKDSGFSPDVRGGFEFWIVDAFACRAGMSDDPSEISWGIGLRWEKFELDYAYVSHSDLGGSHLATITFR